MNKLLPVMAGIMFAAFALTGEAQAGTEGKSAPARGYHTPPGMKAARITVTNRCTGPATGITCERKDVPES